MPHPVRHHVVLAGLIAAVAICGPSLGDLQARGQGGGSPATITFLVVDDAGQPVRDLVAEEVVLRVAGRSRPIESLRRVDFGSPAARDGAGRSAEDVALPAPYAATASDTMAASRSVIVLFNDSTIQTGTEADIRAAIGRFIDALGADARVALMTTPHGITSVEFTRDRAALQAALDAMRGRATPQLSEDDFACQTLEVLGELGGLMASVGRAEAPTTVVFVSGGLADATVATLSRRAGGAACQVRSDSYTALTRVASAAQVHMYVLQATGLDEALRGDVGLESLAGVTSGQRWIVGSSGDAILTRVARETASYYEAIFRREANERSNEVPLEIDVTRPGVTVRAPASVVFADASATDPGDERVSPQDMLRETAGFNALLLKAVGASSRIAPGSDTLRVLALMEPFDRSVELEAAAAGLITEDGRLVAQWTAQEQELSAYPVMAAFDAEPGRYRLRMAATDVDGRAGAVDAILDVALHQADNVHLSDLALLAPRGDDMRPALEFRDEANAVVYFELYGTPDPALFATIDLSRSVDGPALTAVQLQARPSAEADKLLITGTLPIRALQPGDYVVRVTIGRNPRVLLYKTVRKLPPGGV